MKRTMVTLTLLCIMLVSFISTAQAQNSSKKIRIGVYDNRAITTAFFGSVFNPLPEKRAEFERAKAAGDSTKIAELEAWGPRFQRQIQFQGFCKVPIDDILFHVKEHLGKVARDAGVDMIGWAPTFAGSNVETVDITDQLVALYNPNPNVKKEIKIIRDSKPVDLCDIKHKAYGN